MKARDLIRNSRSRNRESTLSVQSQMFHSLYRILENPFASRDALANYFTDPSGKDIDGECGYPKHITFDMYQKMFDRDGVASRVVSIFPNECWAVKPWMYETEKIASKIQTPYERKIIYLDETYDLFGKCNRFDECSRIGHYGVLVYGINDGQSLDKRVKGINENGKAVGDAPQGRKLLWLMPFTEGQAPIASYNTDRKSERYGKPMYYNIAFTDPNDNGGSKGVSTQVHWSRVIHLADDCTTSDIIGTPAQQNVFNYLINIRKTLGGSAEMFWHGGFPGISFETPADIALTGAEFDKEDIAKEVKKFFMGFKRYLALEGGLHANQLNPNIADPDTHIDVQIMAISIAKGIPQRHFMGTEEARLASAQDADSWNRKVLRRQNNHCTPKICREISYRFGAVGILPRIPKVFVKWPDLYSIAQTERADITLKLVKALGEYVKSGAMKVFPPLQFMTMIMDLSVEEAEEVIKAALKAVNDPKLKKLAVDPLAEVKAKAEISAKAKGAGRLNSGKNRPIGPQRRNLSKRPKISK